GTTPAVLALVQVEAHPGWVGLTWYSAEGSGLRATVFRRVPGGEWLRLAEVEGDGTGHIRYEDRAASAGQRLAYRLGHEGTFTAETWVDVPARLALELRGLVPNPATGGEATASFTLATGSPATLELLDVAGRRVSARDVGSLGAGSFQLRLDEARGLAPGLY